MGFLVGESGDLVRSKVTDTATRRCSRQGLECFFTTTTNCAYVCMCVHVYVYIYIYIYMFIYIYNIYICMYVCMYMLVQMYISYACIYVYIYLFKVAMSRFYSWWLSEIWVGIHRDVGLRAGGPAQ